MLEFTNTEGLIFYKKILCISDLHLGIEKELSLNGIYIPSQSKYIFSKIKKIYDRYKPKYLIIDGDFKHNIPKTSLQEISEIPDFVNELSYLFKKIYLVKGNHDGDLEELIPDINNVKVIKELRYKNIVFTHGHLKPKLKGKYYVLGHHHFAKSIRTSIGEVIYEKVFVFAYKKDYNIIFLPTFSDLTGVYDTGSFQTPLADSIERYEVYTLDGILIEEKELYS
ncbi:metallophosphoesterase [Nanobdella aerobiophila]|uniref:Metallophosphoesterase n=1 Tax=Nanobdella aerobiophila TaxID=2586965 RepID=A0A915WS12_9ARCH|nr:metallophosphoesterase [Nanobdella aerobiophila]BBL45864.1 metallophosphoesterase [Nanobdella aerobiophila]